MTEQMSAKASNAAFWQETMRPIEEETAETTEDCLLSDGSAFALGAKVDGTWRGYEMGHTDSAIGEPLPARFRFYRRLASFGVSVGLVAAGGCVVLDALGLCPVHFWRF